MRKLVFTLFTLLFAVFVVYNWLTDGNLPKDQQIEKLVVLKSEREMRAYAGGKLLKTYRIALGTNPIGDKQFEGDRKTPEGIYFINGKNPNSGYHKNLGISYPNALDITEAKILGKPTGGDIKIHGMRNGFSYLGFFHRLTDWTHGCIAVTDAEIDELYAHTPIGTPIEIRP